MVSVITEAQLRRVVQEEVLLQVLEEGIWDDVVNGAVKLRKIIAKRFGSAAAKWGQTIHDKIGKLKELPDDVKVGIEALKVGMKESGESIPVDDNLKAAKELGNFSSENALALAQQAMEGPIHNLAANIDKKLSKSESKQIAAIYSVLLEAPEDNKKQLNEVGVVGALGISLAVLGGLPMLFAGLAKLAAVCRAEKLAALFKKAEHVLHIIEVKTINAAVPNKLSYAAYKFMHKKGLRFSDEKTEMLGFEEYVKDADGSHAIKRVNGLLYKSLLIFFAFHGLAGALSAGASLIGVVEGAATTVKGVELARGAMELAALASKTV